MAYCLPPYYLLLGGSYEYGVTFKHHQTKPGLGVWLD